MVEVKNFLGELKERVMVEAPFPGISFWGFRDLVQVNKGCLEDDKFCLRPFDGGGEKFRGLWASYATLRF